MRKLIPFLVFALLLSTVLPVRAQQLSVTVDTVALNIVGKGPYFSSIHIRNAVKYHDYYYLALHCIDDQRVFDTIVVVSADGKNVTFAGKLILDWEYNKSILWQGTFFVNHDTLYRIENVNTDNPSGYYFDEKSWSWKYLSYVDKAVYEDDVFVVRKENVYGKRWKYMCFTEKQGSFYMETKNGCLQMEPYHRRYIVYYDPDRIVRLGDTYYFLYGRGVDTVNMRQRPGLELRKTAFPDVVWVDNAEAFPWHNGYYTLNDSDDVKHLIGLQKKEGWWMKSDTTYHDAFCLGGQIYFIVTIKNQTYIAQIIDNQLKELLFLKDLYPVDYIDYYYRDSKNKCFGLCKRDGIQGVMTVNDTGIHIRYFTE